MKTGKPQVASALAVLLLAALAILVAYAPAAANQTPALDKIEPLLLLEFATTDSATFLVWMDEKADLSPAYHLDDKMAKGRFVFSALTETAERTQKELRHYLDREGVDYRTFYIANKILVRGGDQRQLFAIASRPDVARISANHRLFLEEPYLEPATAHEIGAIEPNIVFVHADDAWEMGVTGQGIVLAGNDTGLDEDHPAIAPRYRGCLDPPDCTLEDHNYNWWDATGTYPLDPWDGDSHGTHTTGTMMGDDGGSNRIGMAPGASTVHCKNMDDQGHGDVETFTECFQWTLAPWDLGGANPRPDLAPDAVNNSWGLSSGGYSQFKDEISALQAAGIFVEASAGNEGTNGCQTLRSPGDYEQVLTTGSVNHNASYPGTIAAHSSRGPSDLDPGFFPDIMAPGLGIRSSVPVEGANEALWYESWSGTSMAGAHATGLVALVWSACPTLRGKVAETAQLIRETATPLEGQAGASCGGDYSTGPNNDWGTGTIDALAAVQAALALCDRGYLNGHVTDGDTQSGLEDAVISAARTGGGQWQASTDASGFYTMSLPASPYSVSVRAFGYAPGQATSVQIQSDATSTQDFALNLAPRFVISGTVLEAQSGSPLDAQVEALDTPLLPVRTDPNTGFYSMTIPPGTHSLRASADGHHAGIAHLVIDGDQTMDFVLEPLPCILLVDDDDNTPDVQGYYSTALASLGYGFDLFEIGASGEGPTLPELEGYSVVVWFSGDKYGTGGGAGPNPADEANLSVYLDAGGRLFLSSQDYLYDMGRTDFGRDYLGVGQYVDDTGNAVTKYGQAGDPVGDGLGPYPLLYPPGMLEFGDTVTPTVFGLVAFRSHETGGDNLDLSMSGGNWRSVFFANSWVPMYYQETANGEEVLQRILDWFEACGECAAVSGVDFSWEPASPGSGEEVTFAGTALGTPLIDYAWTLGDGITGTGQTITHTYQQDGAYRVVMTATNCVDEWQSVAQTLTVEQPTLYHWYFPQVWYCPSGCDP